MPNIAIRKETENKLAPLSAERWEPFRVLRDLMGWDPFREMAPFALQGSASFAPSFEVKETKDGYLFRADVPGVKEQDLDITVSGNRLTISGKREAERQEQNERYYTYERSYGDFARSFTLPDGVDMGSIHAELKEGVLTLGLRRLPEAQPKRISIQSAAKKS
jgi:HSP20 family protein